MGTKADADKGDAGDAGNDDDRGEGTNEERLERVESAIERLGDLVESALGNADDDDDKGDAGNDDKGDAGAGPRSIAQVEDTTEARVREAVNRLEREKTTDSRLSALEKVTEVVPRKVRKLTSAIWGRDE